MTLSSLAKLQELFPIKKQIIDGRRDPNIKILAHTLPQDGQRNNGALPDTCRG